MEWASFCLDVCIVLMIGVLLWAMAILSYTGAPGSGVACLLPVMLGVAHIRYRIRIAHYFLGRRYER